MGLDQSAAHIVQVTRFGTPDQLIHRLDFGLLVAGQTSAVQTLRFTRIDNVNNTDIVRPRMHARRIDGFYSTRSDESATEGRARGQELMDERWLQVRENGTTAWFPIGGDFGNDGTGLNYHDFPSLYFDSTGGGPSFTLPSFFDVDFRVVVPSDATSLGKISWQVGISWVPDRGYYPFYSRTRLIWEFFDSSSPSRDFSSVTSPSSDGHPATINGATFIERAGGESAHFDFDGVDDNATTASSTDFNLASFTILAWINTAGAGAGRRIIATLNDGVEQYGIALSANVFEAISSKDTTNTAGASLADSTWRMVAMTREGGLTIKMIIDDSLAKTITISDASAYSISSDFRVGEDPDSGAQNFDGKIDHVIYWSNAVDVNTLIGYYRTTRTEYSV